MALRMLPDHTTKKVRFERVQATTLQELGFDPEVGSKRGNTVCLHCGAPISTDYVKHEGRASRVGQQLIAVIATRDETKGKTYLEVVDFQSWVPPEEHMKKHIDELCRQEHLTLPEELLPKEDSKNFWAVEYGLTRFVDLFTPRQLLALFTFTVEVHHAYKTMLEEGMESGRAAAITTYLGLMIDRLADFNSSLCRWVT